MDEKNLYLESLKERNYEMYKYFKNSKKFSNWLLIKAIITKTKKQKKTTKPNIGLFVVQQIIEYCTFITEYYYQLDAF